MKDDRWKISGYTLIEILVALTIVGLIFASGYVSFRDYARRQAFAAVARSLKGDLRLAQEQALSGNKPDVSPCDTSTVFDGYRFRGAADSYRIVPVCSGVEVTGLNYIKVVSLYGVNMSFNPSSVTKFTFKALGQGTDLGSNLEIILTQQVTNNQMKVTVTPAGEIE